MTASGGAEVKNLGEGLLVVFPSAIQATAYAVATQRSVAGRNRFRAGAAIRMQFRLPSGEPYQKEADFFDTAVAAVEGLCDDAEGGQVLASELMAALAGSGGGFRFRLKGDSVKAWRASCLPSPETASEGSRLQ